MMDKLKYIFRAYRYRYLIDPTEINFILKNLKKGDCAVDIGSHKGGYLYWLQKAVGNTGKVYAFEPQPKLYSYLHKIIKICKYCNVIIENKGVSELQGNVDFYIPITKSGSSPGARIGRLKQEENLEKIEIEVITLDTYFFKNKIFPNLIKIDVEGLEKQVLLGGQELLQKCKPKLVLECENRHLDGADIFDVFNILMGLGYSGYFFENGTLKPIREFNVRTHQKAGSGRFWEEKGYVNNFIFEPTTSPSST